MKKRKLIMVLIAVILGISTSFATRVTKQGKRLNQILYAISNNGMTFSWAMSVPAGYSCQAAKGTCTISTSLTIPPPNTYPASYTVINGPDKKSAWMPN